MQEIGRGPLAALTNPKIPPPPAQPTAQPQHDSASPDAPQQMDVPLGPAFAAAAVLTSPTSGAAPQGMQGIPSPTRCILKSDFQKASAWC